MELLDKLTQDYKQAMIDKDVPKKLIINYVLAQIKNKKIELQKDPEEADIISIIKKEVKALDEAIGYLEKMDKPEELAQEKEKKQILLAYLPATLSREQTIELIEKLTDELAITDLKTQRGLLMKELMAKHRSEIDGSLVNEIINAKLG
ncbi:GatB/YqeY domain-containing protein [Patescibacteria group bacterium]|nr:GatB/YqeY domain-containing protein [Patescibacteria group bacterium]MBU1757680.1 GatB/YqeY domain-containing protein [Patescibacteria group bacterium]